MRVSKKTIEQQRQTKAATILLTGGTGLIGSHLAAALLGMGYRVMVLCRSAKKLSAQERIDTILRWLGPTPYDRSRLIVVEATLDKPRLGLNDAIYDTILRNVDEIVHCSANTSFSERKRREIENANITGLKNIIEIGVKSNCYYFHYLSTAYAAGKRSGVCEEKLIETRNFTNVYEETKNRGEHYVAQRCGEEGIQANIYRPSIIYGNAATGKTIRFNGLYYPLRIVYFLKTTFERDIANSGGKNAAGMGVSIDRDGTLYLPLRIEKAQGATLNLISIDYLVRSFIAVMEEFLDGGVFHIVSDSPISLETLTAYANRFFNVRGLRAVDKEEFIHESRNPLERLLDSYLEPYHPYMQDTRLFENEKTRSVQAKRNIYCPDFDYSLFARCMEYAVLVDWGKKLFQPPAMAG
ncbi:MAG: SDR family oxidoreductase [Deltaproteobacteria bacterium]|nr:SDR family oxidoreductase [Deltaproteobacteria bacterium]